MLSRDEGLQNYQLTLVFFPPPSTSSGKVRLNRQLKQQAQRECGHSSLIALGKAMRVLLTYIQKPFISWSPSLFIRCQRQPSRDSRPQDNTAAGKPFTPYFPTSRLTLTLTLGAPSGAAQSYLPPCGGSSAVSSAP